MYKHISDVSYKWQRGVFREHLSVCHAIKFNRSNLNYNPILCYCFAVDTLVNNFSLFWNEISLARGVLVAVKRKCLLSFEADSNLCYRNAI